MKREKLTKSHASSLVILIFTVLFVQGVLFLFRKEELKLRKPAEKVTDQFAGTDQFVGSNQNADAKQVAGNVKNEKDKSEKTPEKVSHKTARKALEKTAFEQPPTSDSSTATINKSYQRNSPSDISWNTYKKPEIVQLNTADSLELVSLPGIGPYYAKMIIEYRSRLGGFASREQLMEIRGIDRQRYEMFAGRVSADTNLINRNAIKDATYEQLAKNPYIGGYLARSIIRFRDENTESALDLVSLLSANIIKKELYKILKFYFH